MSTLERAIEIAAVAHAGVKDQAGAPYILHPLRVMLRLETQEERIVAVLHDVVEDADGWSFERLVGEGFSDAVVEALRSVSKRPDEEDEPSDDTETKERRYLRFVARAGANAIGRRVKLADLQDNMDLSRIANPTSKDFARTEKYRKAAAYLMSLP